MQPDAVGGMNDSNSKCTAHEGAESAATSNSPATRSSCSSKMKKMRWTWCNSDYTNDSITSLSALLYWLMI